MKLITFILTLLILTLSIQPCSDGNNVEDQHKDEKSENHNHQNDSDDSCPVNCICDCCGMAITHQLIQTFDLVINNQISTEMASVYQSMYRFKFHFNIWQPPQLVS